MTADNKNEPAAHGAAITQEKDKMTNPLKVYREQLGLSRAELARRSRAAYMTLTTLENGFQLGISGKTAQRLSPVLGVPAEQIIQSYADYRESLAAGPDAA